MPRQEPCPPIAAPRAVGAEARPSEVDGRQRHGRPRRRSSSSRTSYSSGTCRRQSRRRRSRRPPTRWEPCSTASRTADRHAEVGVGADRDDVGRAAVASEASRTRAATPRRSRRAERDTFASRVPVELQSGPVRVPVSRESLKKRTAVNCAVRDTGLHAELVGERACAGAAVRRRVARARRRGCGREQRARARGGGERPGGRSHRASVRSLCMPAPLAV